MVHVAKRKLVQRRNHLDCWRQASSLRVPIRGSASFYMRWTPYLQGALVTTGKGTGIGFKVFLKRILATIRLLPKP